MEISLDLTRDSYNSEPAGKLIITEMGDEIEINIDHDRQVNINKEEFKRLIRVFND